MKLNINNAHISTLANAYDPRWKLNWTLILKSYSQVSLFLRTEILSEDKLPLYILQNVYENFIRPQVHFPLRKKEYVCALSASVVLLLYGLRKEHHLYLGRAEILLQRRKQQRKKNASHTHTHTDCGKMALKLGRNQLYFFLLLLHDVSDN